MSRSQIGGMGWDVLIHGRYVLACPAGCDSGGHPPFMPLSMMGVSQ